MNNLSFIIKLYFTYQLHFKENKYILEPGENDKLE